MSRGGRTAHSRARLTTTVLLTVAGPCVAETATLNSGSLVLALNPQTQELDRCVTGPAAGGGRFRIYDGKKNADLPLTVSEVAREGQRWVLQC